MAKLAFLCGVIAGVLCCAPPVFAQMNGQAGGVSPNGNSGFGGGNSSSGNFNDYATALRLLHAEDYADAIPFLDRVLADRPRSVDVLNKLGNAHRMVGDLPAARDILQRAIAIDPDNQRAHQYLGETNLAMFDSAAANAQLSELTRLCPDGCDERSALTKDIAAYHAATQPATAPAATH